MIASRSSRASLSLPALNALAPAVDGLAIVAAGEASAALYHLASGLTVAPAIIAGAIAVVALCFVSLMGALDLYHGSALVVLDRQLKWVGGCWLISCGLMLALAFLFRATSELSRGAVLIFFSLGLCSLFAARLLWYYALPVAVRNGLVRSRSCALLIVGERSRFEPQLTAALTGAKVDFELRVPDPEVDGSLSRGLIQAVSRLRGADIQEFLIALPTSQLSLMPWMLSVLRPVPLPVRLVPEGPALSLALLSRRSLGGYAVLDIKRPPLTAPEQAMKRALDLAIAMLAILALAPLLLVVALAIKLETDGPIIFRQDRRGFNGRDFEILKFRTMHVAENGAQVTQARRGDTRVTKVGRWLRRTSIDELPQCWNVLRGEMSVVGPRPHALAHDDFYDKAIEDYAFRQHVKPGLTGWAQVNGHRGETPDLTSMNARVEHDLWYINHWSIWLDIRIIGLTFTRLLSRSAY